ncbi:PDDEXK-like family protein [Leptolyngbya sp. GGD]|uniref:PDDEXK-like family protein n=1 Tax=Leptolyngbya sp. GGD TaxID=2997907 RepID=UPI00227A0301|nr:PD-(D/E)XK nuclease family protein [Leptolyngbya sp. GGD]MCY6492302.1 PD-(D/E)XK nuclease family protein [Leptolyngbya sp. GGD]
MTALTSDSQSDSKEALPIPETEPIHMTLEQEQRAILEKFIIDNPDLEALEAKISQFNIFEAVGMVRQEIKHSNFIQFLLNPSEKHRLGDLFLKKLLIAILTDAEEAHIDSLDIAGSDFSDAEIRREWKNIDLLIYSPTNSFVCVIENKVDAVERPHQLRTYEDVVDKEFRDCKKMFVFLTKEGSPASRPRWISFDYGTIAEIIETVCNERRSCLTDEIYIAIRHYVDLVRRHIMSESDIAELCRKIYKQHRQAIDLIYEHRPDMRSDVEDYIKQLIQEFSQAENIDLDSVDKRYIRFAPKEWDGMAFQKTCPDWTGSDRIFLFEFWNEPQNLCLHLVIGPRRMEIKEAIYQKLKTLNISGLKSKCKIDESKWNHIAIVPILDISDYEDGDLESLQEKIRAFWLKYIQGDMKVIREAIVNCDSLRSTGRALTGN